MPRFLIHLSAQRGGYNDFLFDAVDQNEVIVKMKALYPFDRVIVQPYDRAQWPIIFGSNRPHFHRRINHEVAADTPDRDQHVTPSPKAHPLPDPEPPTAS